MATLASSSHLPPIAPSQPTNSLNLSTLANTPTYLLAQAPPTPAPSSVATPKICANGSNSRTSIPRSKINSYLHWMTSILCIERPSHRIYEPIHPHHSTTLVRQLRQHHPPRTRRQCHKNARHLGPQQSFRLSHQTSRRRPRLRQRWRPTLHRRTAPTYPLHIGLQNRLLLRRLRSLECTSCRCTHLGQLQNAFQTA